MMRSKQNSQKRSLFVEVQYASQSIEDKWAEFFSLKELKKWIKVAIHQDAKILIRCVGRAESKRLNNQYRSQNHATNILTFTLTSNADTSILVADLVLCMPVIAGEATQQNKLMHHHLAHLIIHGILHAQGFDHEDEIDAQAMESLEIALLKKLKIQNPYI
jgi:probable rRNA maturation factor